MPNSAVKPLILVVEDDPAVRNLIVAALEAHGLRHMAVETAHAAIAAASSQAPSIVLLDLGLPDMDGVKVVESARRSGAFRMRKRVVLPPRARSIPVSCISTLMPALPRWMARSCI